MTDYTDLVERLQEHAENMYVDFLNEAADAIELLQRELKCANELWEQQKELALEYLADIEKANERIADLEHQLKFECDTYLWKRKQMSRRIALLEYWMEKLFKYGSSPEAKRNELTMTTEIPDYLMKEGEDILHHLEERSDLEKVYGII